MANFQKKRGGSGISLSASVDTLSIKTLAEINFLKRTGLNKYHGLLKRLEYPRYFDDNIRLKS